MIKVYLFLLIINLISGYARAQVPQVDMRIGSMNNIQRPNNPNNENNSLKDLELVMSELFIDADART